MWWLIGAGVLGAVGILSICPINSYLDDRAHKKKLEEKKRIRLEEEKSRLQAEIAKEEAELNRLEQEAANR